MELIVNDIDIATGGPAVAIINAVDAARLDLHAEDRVKLKKGRKEATVILDVAESKKTVAPGHIGLFEEPLKLLGAKHHSKVELFLKEKPAAVQYIRKKLDGKELSSSELIEIIREVVHNNLSSVELTHFVAACYTQGLSVKEVLSLTKAMVLSGERLKLKGKVMDLHCIGGVPGNRTTMIVVPIIAAAGLQIPKTSSRAITSPAGTADTMEVLAKVDISIEKMKQVIKRTNGCIVWGGAINLAPADDKIIRIEYPLSIDAEGQLLASVMAKKHSVSSNHVLLDIPVGKTTKAKNLRYAKHLKKLFEALGKKLGMKVAVIATDGSQPIGNGVGPALEAADCLKVLKNDSSAPKDLKEKSLLMAGLMLEMGGKAKAGKGKLLAKKLLESGQAYKKMQQIIAAQGKKVAKLHPAKHKLYFRAAKPGTIKEINNVFISKVARLAGAPKDVAAGIYLYKHVGEKVKKGEKVLTVYSENKEKLGYARHFLKEKKCVVVS
jgi:putative thymidine phosphorylase